MRSRTGLALAGALLLTTAPAVAAANPPQPAAVAIEVVADDGTVIGIVTVAGGAAPADLLEPGASDGDDSLVIVDQDGDVFTIHDSLSGDPDAWTPNGQDLDTAPGRT